MFNDDLFRDLILLAAGAVIGGVGGLIQVFLSGRTRRAAQLRDDALHDKQRGEEKDDILQAQSRASAKTALDHIVSVQESWRAGGYPQGGAYDYSDPAFTRVRADALLITDEACREAVELGMTAFYTTRARHAYGDIDAAEYVEQQQILGGVGELIAEYLRGDPLDSGRVDRFKDLTDRGLEASEALYGDS